MMQVKVRHEVQSKAVPFCWIQPNSDIETFIEQLADNGGIYCPAAGQTYLKPQHQLVLDGGSCFLELVLTDAEHAQTAPAKPRRTRKRAS